MPDWQRRMLGEVADLVVGGTPSRAEPRFWAKGGDGHLWASIADMRLDPVHRTAETITEQGVRAIRGRVVRAGTPLMSFKLTVGRVARAGVDLYTNEAIVAVEGRRGVADNAWLYHALPRIAKSGIAESAVKGATLNQASLHSLPVELPPLDEQRRIAEILDTIDGAVESSEGVIGKLAAIRAAMIRDLIPASLPPDWDMVSLDDAIDTARPIVYGILMPGEHTPGGVPVVKVRDIERGTIAKRQDLLHASLAIHQEYRRSTLREGDVLFTIRGTVGRTAVVPPDLDGANITQDTARLAVSRVHPAYLAAWLETHQFRSYVAVHTIGQAVTGMNLRELRRAPLALPPEGEQVRIGEVLASQSERLASEQAYARGLRKLRHGLLSDLLSGHVRVAAA